MSITLVVGTQWGDEGKGKIVDYFSKNADYVVRFQGGNNAGHTIKVGDQIYKLHLVPSGVVQGKTGVIGNGCVIDPGVLIYELDELIKRGINPKLLISDRAGIVMPYHKILDGAEEDYLGNKKIGTTKRGIGPCYSDKIARRGLRATDLLHKNILEKKLKTILPLKQKIIDLYGIDHHLDTKAIAEEYTRFGNRLRKYIQPIHIVLNQAAENGENILLEGAQGAMLDIDFGTYPYTTSSHTIAGGSSIGTGIPPRYIDDIIGVVKAYTTRVGEGPLPTEQFDRVGKHLAEKGHEFGTTTQRLRRCGWLDLVVVRHACLISGINRLAITKLDVLDGFKTVKVCTRYRLHGDETDIFPADVEQVNVCEPVYQEFNGWNKIEKDVTKLAELPDEAQDYLRFIEKELQTPLAVISIGPGRKETIEL
jgi:adenylosuccinate synthase